MDNAGNPNHRHRLAVLNRVLRHDVRNSANIIIGNADLLLEHHPEATRAETIRDAAYEMVERTDTTSQAAHALETSSLQQRIDLTEVLCTCADQFREAYPDTDIQMNIPEEGWVVASERIELVFENVIENAIEHNDKDTPVVSITATTSEESVTVETADNGPGIPENEQRIIEQETQQAQHSRGLGLWLVNWLVDDSGGEVSIGENDPHGSVVTIDLPHPE